MNQTTEYLEFPKANREYKSTLFCKVFEDKKHLLELYNGVNQTNYQNIDDLEVNTLENVVYITMKNDLSFLIDCNMSLYEHQSTLNPNMPLRGFLYLAQLYNKYIERRNLNLFSSSGQKIPIPQYVVFYNGTQEQPDEQMLLLSDLFQGNGNRQEKGCLECQARMLNINYGHNKDLLNKCRRLEEYAIFVAKVRRYATEDIEKRRLAITRAINECIEEGILVDILKEQKAEVLELVLTTFNRELYEQGLKEEATKEANEKILDLTQQLKDRDKELKDRDKELKDKDKELKDKDKELKDRDKELAELKAKLAEFTNK